MADFAPPLGLSCTPPIMQHQTAKNLHPLYGKGVHLYRNHQHFSQSKGSNPRPGSTVQIRSIAVYRSTFGIVLDTSGYDAEQCDPDCPPTYAAIQKWIEDNHGVKVSKSSVTMVKDKCGALKLDFKAGKEPDSGIIKTAKERLVLEAFRVFGVV